MRLYQVRQEDPCVYAGFVMEGDYCVRAANILAPLRHKRMAWIERYCRLKGVTIVLVDEGPDRRD